MGIRNQYWGELCSDIVNGSLMAAIRSQLVALSESSRRGGLSFGSTSLYVSSGLLDSSTLCTFTRNYRHSAQSWPGLITWEWLASLRRQH